ncbi:MAG: hypothetical protein R2853_12015 [Thermomicrobiales bacterium]
MSPTARTGLVIAGLALAGSLAAVSTGRYAGLRAALPRPSAPSSLLPEATSRRNIGSEPGSKPVIQVEGLTKRYGKALALNRVSFDAAKAWRSGDRMAGKTTILRCFLAWRADGSVLKRY